MRTLLLWLALSLPASAQLSTTGTGCGGAPSCVVAICTGTIALTVLTITSCSSGTISNGNRITGTGVTQTTITSPGTGIGLAGTYNIGLSQTVSGATTITFSP